MYHPLHLGRVPGQFEVQLGTVLHEMIQQFSVFLMIIIFFVYPL